MTSTAGYNLLRMVTTATTGLEDLQHLFTYKFCNNILYMERQEGEKYMTWWMRNNRDRYNQIAKNYREKHKEQLSKYNSEYKKRRQAEDPEYRMKLAEQAKIYNQKEEVKLKNRTNAKKKYHENAEVREKRLQQMKERYSNRDEEYKKQRAEYYKQYHAKRKEGIDKPKRIYEKVSPVISNE